MHHGDLDFMAAMLGDPEVMRYYPRRMTVRERLQASSGRWTAISSGDTAALDVCDEAARVGCMSASEMHAWLSCRPHGIRVHFVSLMHPTSTSYQLIQLLHQFRKPRQRRVHRLAAFHVHAGVAEQIQRVFAAAAAEEAEVGVELLFAAV